MAEQDLFGDSHSSLLNTEAGLASPLRGTQIPWAEVLRPKHFNEIVGQEHLLAEGKPLHTAFISKQLHSMILWGPPGVGKTTLARLSADVCDYDFIALSAVLAGVKDIRQAIEQAKVNAKKGQGTILFIDEIHRFNKSQQDALLPFVESGLVIFIGATTENPSFEVNSALLSRAQVYVLRPLQKEALRTLIKRATANQTPTVVFNEEAQDALIAYADGDARRLLNMLERAYRFAVAHQHSTADAKLIQQATAAQGRRFDKKGEQFYDQISALHKSVRGSDADAALYWLVRMLDGGVDARYLARRIVRMAWEDIGLADPRAIQLALDAAMTYERLGSPEGDLALAQSVIYLAVAAKSNAGYMAYKKALAFVKEHGSDPVPMHLRNAPTGLMQDLGYGKNYRYAHDEDEAYAAAEQYFPDGLPQRPEWYKPVARGLEIQIAEKIDRLRALDKKYKGKSTV